MRLAAALAAALLLAGGCRPGGDGEGASAYCDIHAEEQSPQTLEETMAGEVHVPGFDVYRLTEPVDWEADPFGHPSWRLAYHALDFLWPAAVEEPEAAAELVRDWEAANPWDGTGAAPEPAWGDHATSKRALVIACLDAQVGGFSDLLRRHVRVIKDVPHFYRWRTNHGMHQNVALLAAACRIGDDAAADEALRRMRIALQRKVDDQGVFNEQSAAYQWGAVRLVGWFNHHLDVCGRDERLSDAKLRRAFAAMLTPDGEIAPVGDVPPNRPTGVEPATGVQVFDAGWVTGRRGDTSYLLRFGPGRFVHGHADHTSLLLYRDGPLVTEGGFNGYGTDEMRAHLIGPRAHNVTVARDLPFDLTAATALTEQRVEGKWQSYRFEDMPHEGVTRVRRVLVQWDPLLVVVHDTLTPAVPSLQLWHLAERPSLDGDEARVGDVTISVLSGDARIVEGQRHPLLGWQGIPSGGSRPLPTLVVEGDGEHLTVIHEEPFDLDTVDLGGRLIGPESD